MPSGIWSGPLTAADQNLGERLTVEIDKSWNHRRLWDHPLGFKLNFTYVSLFDDGIQENASPNYADTDVVGRAELYKHWISTASREIPLTFHFVAQVRSEGSLQASLRTQVVWPARWLDKLKYPVYDQNAKISYPPPSVLLRIGSLFFGRCVLSAAEVQWKPPFDPISILPYNASVTCTFAVQRRSRPDLGYNRQSVDRGVWQ